MSTGPLIRQIINQAAFSNACGVSVGAVLSLSRPLDSPASSTPQIRRPPVSCAKCPALANAHCAVDFANGGVWKCCFCGHTNTGSSEFLGSSRAACSDLAHEAVVHVSSRPVAPPRTHHSQQPLHLVLIVDATLEPSTAADVRAAILDALSGPSSPSPLSAALLTLITFDAAVCVHDLNTGAAHVLPGHASAAPQVLNFLAGCGASVSAPLAASLPRLESVLAGFRPLEADCVGSSPGAPPHAGPDACRARARCLGPAIEAGLRCVAIAASTAAAAAAAGKPPRPPSPTKPAARAGQPAGSPAGSPPSSSGGAARSPPQQARPAPEVPPVTAPTSRLIVLTGGPATKGPGSVPLHVLDSPDAARGHKELIQQAEQYWDALAGLAASHKGATVVDVVAGAGPGCSGRPSSLAALGKVATASGGTLTRHPGFGPLLAPHLAWLLSRHVGCQGVLDVIVSQGLNVTQVLGPVQQLGPSGAQAAINAAAAAAQGYYPAAGLPQQNGGSGGGGRGGAAPRPPARRLSPRAVRVSPGVEVGQGFTIRLEHAADLRAPAAFIQVQLSWIAADGRLWHLVVTRRWAVTDKLTAYVGSIDAAAAGVVLAKRFAADARQSSAAADARCARDVRAAVAAQVNLIASRFGREITLSGGFLGFGAQRPLLLPQELLPLAHALYHLQRGPMLSHGTGAAAAATLHPEERALLIDALLDAPFEHAQAGVSPRLFLLTELSSGTVQVPGVAQAAAPKYALAPLPPVSLPLAIAPAGTVLALDIGHVVCLMAVPAPGSDGADLAIPPQLLHTCAEAVSPLTAGRFPPPALVAATAAPSSSSPLPPPPPPSSCSEQQAQQERPLWGCHRQVFVSALVPVHADTFADMRLQCGPQLLQGITNPQLHDLLDNPLLQPVGRKQQTDDPSFMQWCRALNVQPIAPAGVTW